MQQLPLGTFVRRVVIGAVLLASSVSVGAQASGLTLAQALDLAQKHHPSLSRSALELAARQRQADQAWAPLLPNVSVSPGLSRANTVPETPGAPGTPPWAGSLSTSVTVTLALSTLADLQTARSNLTISRASDEVARRTLEKTVKTAFYGLLLQQEGLLVEEQSLDRIRGQYDQTRLSHQAGLVSDLDLMTAQASLATAQNSVEGLRQALVRQREQFFLFLSPDLTGQTVLVGTLPDPTDFSSPLPIRLGTAPDLALLRVTQQGTRTARDIQSWAPWLPTLTVGWSTVPARADLGNPESKWTDTAGGLTLGATWSLNGLLPWGTRAEATAQLDDQLARLQSQYDEESRLHALQKRHQEGQILQSLASLRVLTANLALTQRAYDLTAEAYRRGTKDALAVRAAEGELQKAQYSILNERYSLALAAVNLEYETAGVPR